MKMCVSTPPVLGKKKSLTIATRNCCCPAFSIDNPNPFITQQKQNKNKPEKEKECQPTNKDKIVLEFLVVEKLFESKGRKKKEKGKEREMSSSSELGAYERARLDFERATFSAFVPRFSSFDVAVLNEAIINE